MISAAAFLSAGQPYQRKSGSLPGSSLKEELLADDRSLQNRVQRLAYRVSRSAYSVSRRAEYEIRHTEYPGRGPPVPEPMQGGLKVKRSLFSVALACFAVAAAVPASAQINTGSLPNVDHGPFNLAEAYPCTVGTFADNLGITPLQVFNGTGTNCTVSANNGTPGAVTTAAPGILCLKRPTNANGVPTSFALDVNCFAVTPSGQFGCVVQAYRFFKLVPGSFKCPDVYGLPHFDSKGNIQFYTYVQFGSGIRTWWSLNFTQPGTRFLLQVVSACQFIPRDALGNAIGVQRTHIHMDSWRWRVTADEHTLGSVIQLMHGGAVSTLEVPCILGEDMYDALKQAQVRLGAAISSTSGTRLNDIGDALFDMEALIVANCLFVEVLNPLQTFPGAMQFGAPNIQPPGNLAQTVVFGTQGSVVAGIIDTIENPCCCKLLVDLEWIAIRNGIVGQSPTLPTF
jgi:hypothetical protein